MMMNFAEEPQAPEPGTVPAGEAPAVDAPAADPSQTKIDALQSSLDAALEELSKAPEQKPAEPTPAAPVVPTPAPTPAPAPIPAAPVSKDEPWKQAVDNIRRESEEFRNTTVQELEGMKLKDEMIGLTSEISAAVLKYPNIDPNKILLEVEAGSPKTIDQIAAEQQADYQSLVDKISKEQEEKIRMTLLKENEGKIKVPQSSGTSSAPMGTPAVPGSQMTMKASQDAAWADATKAAKANLQ